MLKDYEKVLKAKNELRKLDTTNLDLLERSKIFVSQSLCSYYHLLWSTSKKLYGTCRNFGWYVSNGSIKIKLWENSWPLYVSYIEDFKKYFPDIDFQFVNKYHCAVCKCSTGCFLELLLSSLFMSLLINFFLFFFKFLFLTFNCELQISRGSHREVFLTIMVPVRQGHFVRNFVN